MTQSPPFNDFDELPEEEEPYECQRCHVPMSCEPDYERVTYCTGCSEDVINEMRTQLTDLARSFASFGFHPDPEAQTEFNRGAIQARHNCANELRLMFKLPE